MSSSLKVSYHFPILMSSYFDDEAIVVSTVLLDAGSDET